ncbi:MAG: MFS transporter [candidate division KSB1 bacterium]|nr:MFS transporter [candidate division KSB1 bacterium]
MKKKLPFAVIALGLTSLFTDIATEMIYPLVPVFVSLLGAGAMALGVIEGLAESIASLLKLFSGVWTDRTGRRKRMTVIGYTISTVFRPLTGFATSVWQIVAVRAADRVGKGIRTSPRDALLAAAAPPEIRGKAFGFHRAMDHTGAVIGPLVSLLLLTLLAGTFHVTEPMTLLRRVFQLAIIPGALAVFMLLFFVKEPPDSGRSPEAFRFSLKPFDRRYTRFLAVILLFTLGNSSDAFLLYRAHEALQLNRSLLDKLAALPIFTSLSSVFNQTTLQQLIDILFLPLFWSFFHIIKVIFSTPFGALSDRIGRRRVISTGWIIYAVVYACFAFLHRLPQAVQLPAIFILFSVYALYYALCEGAEKALIADLVQPSLRGSAFGLYHFTVGLAAFPASLLFGTLYSLFGGSVAFLTGAALAAVSVILLTAWVKLPETK